MSPQITALIIYALCNVLSFLAYGRDKQRAIEGGRRTPENILYWWAVIGIVGAIAGMLFFRHKTRKASFKIVIAVIAVLEIALALWFAHMMYGWPV